MVLPEPFWEGESRALVRAWKQTSDVADRHHSAEFGGIHLIAHWISTCDHTFRNSVLYHYLIGHDGDNRAKWRVDFAFYQNDTRRKDALIVYRSGDIERYQREMTLLKMFLA